MLNFVALCSHTIRSWRLLSSMEAAATVYKSAFLLGKKERKSEFINKLQPYLTPESILQLPKLSLHFLKENVESIEANAHSLPVLIHAFPENYSCEDYFNKLKTKELGQIVLFVDVITSCMDLMSCPTVPHGFTVMALKQTEGVGRSGNVWVSPQGCAMFAMQIHIPLSSYLGQHVTLLQHLVGLAIVTAVVAIPGYEVLNLRLKWPNDIYVGDSEKVGGILVTSTINDKYIACNIGCGINLSNEFPTTCINNLIEKHNQQAARKLEKFTLENFFAIVFSKLETILDEAEVNMPGLLRLYYKYWLHSDAVVSMLDAHGAKCEVTVLGIDEFGFLLVRDENGVSFSVQSSENSFDILRGQIKPKRGSN